MARSCGAGTALVGTFGGSASLGAAFPDDATSYEINGVGVNLSQLEWGVSGRVDIYQPFHEDHNSGWQHDGAGGLRVLEMRLELRQRLGNANILGAEPYGLRFNFNQPPTAGAGRYDRLGALEEYNNASGALAWNPEIAAKCTVQNRMRRCVMKDTIADPAKPQNSVGVLPAPYWIPRKGQMGTAAKLDGTDGQVMVEIPEVFPESGIFRLQSRHNGVVDIAKPQSGLYCASSVFQDYRRGKKLRCRSGI